jgi:O-antigen/teichoic acid export membrane protein
MMVRMSLIYLLGRYGASGLTLLALSLYTRLATPQEYGVYALVMALASALYACFGQWLRQILLRFAPIDIQGRSPLPSLILQAFIGICAFIALALLASQFFLSEDTLRTLSLALMLLTVMGCFELALAWLQLQLQPGFYVSLSLFRTGLAALLGVTALHFGLGAKGLVLATVIGYGLAAIPVFIKTGFGLGPSRAALANIKSMLSYGLPLAISAALGSALMLADRALIAALISTEAAGLYAAPYDLAMRTLQVLMLAINLAGTPLILRAFESGDWARTEMLLGRQWLLLVCAGLPVTLAMTLMPQGIAGILLGPSFRETGADLMPLVAMATFLQGLESFYFGFAFALTKKPLRQTAILFVAMVVNIGLTIWLVPIIGIRGGAWATLVSAILALLGSAVLGSSLQRLPLAAGPLVRIAFAACPMALTILWIAPHKAGETIMAGLISSIAYAAALIVFDVAGLRQAVARIVRSRFTDARPAGGIS